MSEHTMMTVTPALILSVGESFAVAMREVEHFFFQSDTRRSAISSFRMVGLRGKKFNLLPVSEAETGRKHAAVEKELICTAMTESMETIKADIRSTLHDLRSHEKIMQVGLGGKSNLPLDVLLVADLTQVEASVLESLLPMINVLLEEEPYAKVHLLLSVAVFTDDKESRNNARETLEALHQILQNREHGGLPQVYLFDRCKEGVWETKDHAELETILGNFVMALLSGGLAQRLAHQISPLDVDEKRAYFCSASATALTFDIEQLKAACAARLGAEIVESEFSSQIEPDPIPVAESALSFTSTHAALQVWTHRLCRDSLFHERGAGQVEIHFSDLCFEDAPMEDWSRMIQQYELEFKTKALPIQSELIAENANRLRVEFQEILEEFVAALPQQTRFYPGGIRSAQMVIEKISKEMEKIHLAENEGTGKDETWDANIKASLEALDLAMQTLPKPPRWIFRLPSFLRKPAVQIFNLIFLYRELRMLTDLRQSSIRLLEEKYESWAKSLILQKAGELREVWLGNLQKHQKSLKRLQSKMDKLHKHLAAQTVMLVSSPSMFRLSVLDESVLAWAYYHGKRPADGFRHTLLSEYRFFDDWQKASLVCLEERLETFCKDVYRALEHADLEEALRHRDGKDAAYLARVMSQGSIPLLRPNFDQTGSGNSFQARFFQCKDPLNSLLYPVFKADEQEWQVMSSDDDLLATCCRVRMMIPFSALQHLFAVEESKEEA